MMAINPVIQAAKVMFIKSDKPAPERFWLEREMQFF
jgi:hypothetical protein